MYALSERDRFKEKAFIYCFYHVILLFKSVQAVWKSPNLSIRTLWMAPFLVTSFDRYKEYIIYLISFSKFSDVLHAYTCARAIGNLWSACLGVNIFNPFPFVGFNGNVSLLKALIVNFQPS